MKIVFLITVMLLIGCHSSKHKSEWTKTVYKLCKQSCPKNTFSYRVEAYAIHVGPRCYCYPQFGAPRIKEISYEAIANDIERNNAKPFKNKGE